MTTLVTADEKGRLRIKGIEKGRIRAIARSMGAKVLSSDKTGFAGCARVDPGTGLEYSPW